MTKIDLVKLIARRTQKTFTEVEKIVDMTFETIGDTLISEGKFCIKNIASFTVTESHRKKSRNPSTGETIDIPDRKRVATKFSKVFKARLNNG